LMLLLSWQLPSTSFPSHESSYHFILYWWCHKVTHKKKRLFLKLFCVMGSQVVSHWYNYVTGG
jgi:hypothetical protein